MAWHLADNPDEFWSAAGAFLQSRPVEHTFLLTLTDTLRHRDLHYYGPGDPQFGWYAAAGEVLGACLQTPPYPLLLTVLPAGAAAELAVLLAGRSLPAVNGLTADAEAFADAWPAPAKVGLQTRLFRLDTLTPPTPTPPGSARVAGPADRELLVAWLIAFQEHPASRSTTRPISSTTGSRSVGSLSGSSTAGRCRSPAAPASPPEPAGSPRSTPPPSCADAATPARPPAR
jgi:hypothetical protein